MANLVRIAAIGAPAVEAGPSTLEGNKPPSLADASSQPAANVTLGSPAITHEESYEALKARADKLEQLVESRITTVGRRRMAPAVRDPNGERPSSLLANAWRGGSTSELATAAAHNAPLQLQLMLPLLLLGVLFGIVSIVVFAAGGDLRRGSAGAGGGPRGKHRRTASGEPVVTPEDEARRCRNEGPHAYSSPRRGFAFCGSWSHGLVEEGAAGEAQRAGGGAGAQGGGFALPASYVAHEPERRSPARPSREEGRPLDV